MTWIHWLLLALSLYAIVALIKYAWEEEHILRFLFHDQIAGPTIILIGAILIGIFVDLAWVHIVAFIHAVGVMSLLLCPVGFAVVMIGAFVTWWRVSRRDRRTTNTPRIDAA